MNIEWTHRKVRVTDVRKVRKFYILSIDDPKITSPLFVDIDIFEGRVRSYYLKESDSISREDILNVEWNMVINQGFFIKTDENKKPTKVYKTDDKFYVSFLEIDGPLGTHISS